MGKKGLGGVEGVWGHIALTGLKSYSEVIVIPSIILTRLAG